MFWEVPVNSKLSTLCDVRRKIYIFYFTLNMTKIKLIPFLNRFKAKKKYIKW